MVSRNERAEDLERLDLLFDAGSFEELGLLGKQPGVRSPADAVVTGFGGIDGRPVVGRALVRCEGKQVERPWRKRGIVTV